MTMVVVVRWIWLLLLWSGAVESALGQTVANTSTLDEVTSDFWQWRLKETPEFATSVGVQDYDDRLETYTLEAFRHRKEKCEEFLARLDESLTSPMSADEYTEHYLLRYDLQTFIDGYEWRTYGSLNPINFIEGIDKDYSYWLDAMTFEDDVSFDRYMVRLRALATQINEKISLMKEAIRQRHTSHMVAVEAVPQQIQLLIQTSAVGSPLFRPLNDSLEYLKGNTISPSKVEKIRASGAAVIEDQVLPAYRKLKYFLIEEYIPNTRLAVSVSSLTNGRQYYEACLKWYLSDTYPVETLHQMGVNRIAEIHQRMNEIKDSFNYPGNLKEFLKFVHGGNKFFYATQGELLKSYRNVILRKISKQISRFFKYNYVTPLRVEPMPFDGPLGVMMPGSEDGSMPPIFFVSVKDPHKTPKWKITAVALRETVPGRHLQNCYEKNMSLPLTRKYREYRKSFSVPFQFPFHTAYTEGWALYAETLGKEMGLFTHGYNEFGQLFSELYKACEMVIDTGIHAFGWNKQQAVTYLTQNTGLRKRLVETDVDRIITLPGQAVGPEFAHLKIQQLRREAQEKLGPLFDIKEFHHAVLKNGPVPLRALENELSTWIYLNSYSTGSSSLSSPQHTNWVLLIVGLSVHMIISLLR